MKAANIDLYSCRKERKSPCWQHAGKAKCEGGKTKKLNFEKKTNFEKNACFFFVGFLLLRMHATLKPYIVVVKREGVPAGMWSPT